MGHFSIKEIYELNKKIYFAEIKIHKMEQLVFLEFDS
jgi:hypothetical protein